MNICVIIQDTSNWLNKFAIFYNNQAQILKQELDGVRTAQFKMML